MDAFEFPIDATWVPSKNTRSNKPVLVDPYGNRLIKKSDYGSKVFYWCGRKDLNCPVRVTLDKEANQIVSIRHEHNHDSAKLQQFITEKTTEVIQNAARNPTIAPRVAFRDLTTAVLSSPATSPGIGSLPKSRTLARQIQRKRKANLGVVANLPQNWEDHIIPDLYKVTKDGQDFNILDVETGEGKKVWGFMSPTCLNIAKNSTHLWVDGTFEIVSKSLFEQLWIIVGTSEANNITIPLAYFLLPNKSGNSYQIVLQAIKDLGVQEVEVFHCDFELAAIKAIAAVYPEAKIEGCDVHWKRALRQAQSRVGLLRYSEEDVTIQNWIRLLWSLSYVPIDDVLKVFTEYVLPNMPEIDDDEENQEEAADFEKALEDYIAYFEATYLGKVNLRTGMRGRPRFKYEYWNHFDIVSNDSGEITNNKSEAFNSLMKITIPMAPNIFTILKAIQDEDAISNAKFRAAIAGNVNSDPNPSRTKRYIDRKNKLKGLLEQYATLELKDYMEALMSFHND